MSNLDLITQICTKYLLILWVTGVELQLQNLFPYFMSRNIGFSDTYNL